jgi:hypothetical protein
VKLTIIKIQAYCLVRCPSLKFTHWPRLFLFRADFDWLGAMLDRSGTSSFYRTDIIIPSLHNCTTIQVILWYHNGGIIIPIRPGCIPIIVPCRDHRWVNPDPIYIWELYSLMLSLKVYISAWSILMIRWHFIFNDLIVYVFVN